MQQYALVANCVLFWTVFAVTFARDKCVWGSGKLECKKNPTKAGRVEVRLMDWDGGTFFDSDDQMGYEITNDDGTFKISGCGDDLFPWNSPDPYLKIFHYCNTDEGETVETSVDRTFVPEQVNYGTIVLDS